jgi:DNA repair photolyase
VRIDPIIPFVNDDPQKLIATLASIGVKHITSSTYKAKPDNWKRLSLAMPQIAEKLKPLYFQQGERSGGNMLLPRDFRFNEECARFGGSKRYEVWGLQRRLTPIEHGAM